MHLKNLETLGARINLDAGYVEADTTGLQGREIVLDFPSVGATENIMMAAVFAEGVTVIKNAALEPEVDDLANFLNTMGAKIQGIGTKEIKIEGVNELNEVEYEPIGDRIEAATYVVAGLMTRSKIKVLGFNPEHISFITDLLQRMGASLEIGSDYILVNKSDLKGATIETAPYPGFPTDVQAQMMSLLTQVEGGSTIVEHIFENRFMHVPELNRMGAKINLEGNKAFIEGKCRLKGAPVMCTDLRASAALILAALVSEGETEIRRVYHLDRGYEQIDSKLSNLGVEIKRVK